MEQRGGADEFGPGLEGDTALSLDVFQLLDGGKVAVDQDRVGQGPQMLSGLQLGRVRGQEE